MVNKKGWARIIEAFVAMLIISAIVLIIIEQDQNKREDISPQIYSAVISTIREIQINNTLRDEIVDVSNASLPVEWGDFNSTLPLTADKIIDKTPNYLDCSAKLCAINDSCVLSNAPDQEIYAESVIISSTIQTYNPRLLKIFCWKN